MRLSFSQFGVLMSRLNCEKDSLIGQTLHVQNPSSIFGQFGFFRHPLLALGLPRTARARGKRSCGTLGNKKLLMMRNVNILRGDVTKPSVKLFLSISVSNPDFFHRGI